MCFDLQHFPALPDDPASSAYHELALKAWRGHRIPGSNNASAPSKAAARLGKWPLVDPAEPQPGYYRVRLVPRGPFVPCRFFYTVGCEVNGIIENPHGWWLQACQNPISKEEYHMLEAWCGDF